MVGTGDPGESPAGGGCPEPDLLLQARILILIAGSGSGKSEQNHSKLAEDKVRSF